MRTLMLAAMLVLSTTAMAEQAHLTTTAASLTAESLGTADETDADPHPAVPTDATWAGSMVIVLALLFLSAAVVGPVVRANMPAEMPMGASHEEDASHHGPAAAHGHDH